MTPLLFLAVSFAGGVGAAARFVVDGAVSDRLGRRLPVGTGVVNLTGSLALGLITGLWLAGPLSAEWQVVLGVGLLGGYTTFSTASYETVTLLIERRPVTAALNGLGMLVLTVVAAAAGLAAGFAVA